ncbi:TIGR00297 family protein [Leptolyngbya cf. ectocarpi LEGE 11479]|uniref:TIGR00297 family protein n=1 Tax=Leptolyngbya cf. ectocarpi LEGE 11479 TaxID=1828722 RepID=A0A928ZQU2_LEPEC|nr:TIGR00297 family protein [Leptolyngbya ectocarpi]MBE9066610.1 TIGR00297 family protein [Leptolyngbya cf. ectocarpi LEGE 11479]
MTWQNPWLVALGLNTVLVGLAFVSPKKLLTPMGYLHAWVLGVIIWGCLGWQAYGVTLVYFAAGSAVTKVGFAEKAAAGIAEERGGVRGPGNVWGSALTAAICALLAGLTGVTAISIAGLSNAQVTQLLILGFVASLSTKLADTSATEIGKAYGQRTFLITTLQPVPRGTEGAVSLEGTLAGVVGSLILAVAAWGLGFIPAIGIGICAVAAFVATTIESLIGATLEDKLPGLTHDVVNIINTLIGAVVAIAIALAGQFTL